MFCRFATLILLCAAFAQNLIFAKECASDDPRVLLTVETLAAIRERLEASDSRTRAHWAALERAAEAWRSIEPYAPAEFHVPLFYHDKRGHRAQKQLLLESATIAYGLALRYRLGGDEGDAAQAVRHLRPWFQHVQYRGGQDTELVFCYTFPLMIYAADLLRGSPSWTSADRTEFDAFLERTALPLHTAGRRNNHGAWGNLLRMAIAAYCDDQSLLQTAVERHSELIATQIGEKGEFVEEVTRNGGVGEQGISYSHFTLGPLAVTALIAENRGIPLFDYRSPNGRSLEMAWRTLVPWTAKPASFPYFKGEHLSEMINVTTTQADFFSDRSELDCS